MAGRCDKEKHINPTLHTYFYVCIVDRKVNWFIILKRLSYKYYRKDNDITMSPFSNRKGELQIFK